MWNKFILHEVGFCPPRHSGLRSERKQLVPNESGVYDPRYSGGIRNGAIANSEFGIRNAE
ncbi:MAG: hypothetical protein IJZ04_04620 [Clostridia bacterium]|nr:hypothetical protein [Clostridia bacterium]